MFQGWEDIPSQFMSESSIDWEFIDAWKRAEEAGTDAAFMAWASYTGECDYEAFEDAYCDEAGSEEEYAVQYVEDHGLLADMPESLRGYFDFEAYGLDLFMNGLTLISWLFLIRTFRQQTSTTSSHPLSNFSLHHAPGFTGLIESILKLMDLPLYRPDDSLVSKRAKNVNISIKTPTSGEISQLAIDATGLKVFGEGVRKVRQH